MPALLAERLQLPAGLLAWGVGPDDIHKWAQVGWGSGQMMSYDELLCCGVHFNRDSESAWPRAWHLHSERVRASMEFTLSLMPLSASPTPVASSAAEATREDAPISDSCF